VTSSPALLEDAIWVKSTHLKNHVLKPKKYGNIRHFYINHHSKDRLDIEFTVYGELMPE